MSGGGGSGDIGPSGPSDDLDCSRLAFETQLASPDPNVVGDLREGDVLELDLQVRDGGRHVIAALRPADQRFVGAITERTTDLVRCMQQGVRYVAEVIHIDGGWVDVRVRAA
jgi:hypothetical protein